MSVQFRASLQGETSGLTVGYRVLDATGTQLVAWTATGVIERALGDGLSNYFTPLLTLADAAHILEFRQNSGAGAVLGCDVVVPLPATPADVQYTVPEGAFVIEGGFTEDDREALEALSDAASTGNGITINPAGGAITEGGFLTVTIANRLIVPFEGFGPIAIGQKVWFSINAVHLPGADDALLRVERTTGLTRLNGATYATTGHGTVTITDATAGDGYVTINEAATALLEARSNVVYSFQVLSVADGPVDKATGGGRIVSAGVEVVS